jgi:hypothetical protein
LGPTLRQFYRTDGVQRFRYVSLPVHSLDATSDTIPIGAGEYIIRVMLARAVAEAIGKHVSKGLDIDPHDILHHVLVERFWGEPWMIVVDLSPTNSFCSVL